MRLRFGSRGDHPRAVIHLVVVDGFRLGDLARARGQALCRPSLPNLEPLLRQVVDHDRPWCEDCIDQMERARSRRHIELPEASGLRAGDLIRQLRQEREQRKPPRKRRSVRDIARMTLK
jgi:hypothetical protein